MKPRSAVILLQTLFCWCFSSPNTRMPLKDFMRLCCVSISASSRYVSVVKSNTDYLIISLVDDAKIVDNTLEAVRGVQLKGILSIPAL